MSSFYQILEEAIKVVSIDKKESLLREAFLKLESSLDEKEGEILDFKTPAYSQICQIVSPNNLPKRANFNTKEGLGALLHSIAHIEYNAIDLALDAVYRFRDTPAEYKKDWLEVAEDEIRHFLMIEKILNSLGYRYGDFPVHQSLFIALKKTKNSLLDRMAVVPRFYEATGLDVNPKIVQKLKSTPKKTDAINESIKALGVIYQEEISHVKKGDRWFKWECDRLNLDYFDTFFKILEKYKLLKRAVSINTKARLEAGFECKELKKFGVKKC